MWPWSLESRLQRLEYADDAKTAELKILSERLGSATSQIASLSQDIKTAPAAQVVERLESLERRFSSLHEMLVTKSPATGEPTLSKAGKAFKRMFRA